MKVQISLIYSIGIEPFICTKRQSKENITLATGLPTD
jgi:hypothetical protein